MRRHHTRRAIIDSLESMLLMSASTIEGTDASDWIAGDGNDNTIFAGAGNDEIHAPLGNNIIDGGSGDDTLIVYEGNRSDFDVSRLNDGSFQVRGPGLNGDSISSRLINVENISFNDGLLSLNSRNDQNTQAQPDNNSGSPPPSAVDSSGTNLNGTSAGEWIAATEGNDNIHAGDGNDVIHAPLGNNSINGGSGFDTLIVYEGNRSQYSIAERNDGSYRISGPGLNGQQQINLLDNVERIQFNDQFVDLQSDPSASAQQQQQQQGFADPAPQTVQPPQLDPPQQIEPNVRPAQPAVSDFVEQVVDLTNQIRTRNGLSQLTYNFELQAAAVGHSRDMAYQDFFSHTGLDGQEPWDRAVGAGYDYQTIGENIAAGQLTPDEVVQAWFDSASHRANLLNPDFTEIGVGYTFLQNDTGAINFNHYWSQLLGSER